MNRNKIYDLTFRWVRGKLEQVFVHQNMKKATIFLIDYGVTLHDIEMADDVRRLDNQFMDEDPLAFQVILSGLSPVSMNSASSRRSSRTPRQR